MTIILLLPPFQGLDNMVLTAFPLAIQLSGLV